MMFSKPPHLFQRFFRDSKASEQPPKWYHYLLQPILIMVFVFVVLYFFRNAISNSAGSANLFSVQETISWAIGVSSLASSAFIIFAEPHAHSANGLVLLVSYLIAFIVGAFIHWLLSYVMVSHTMLHIQNFFPFACLTALGLGVTLWLMVLFDLHHPPAASVTIVLIVDMDNYYTITVIAIAAITLAILHFLLRPFLRQLR